MAVICVGFAGMMLAAVVGTVLIPARVPTGRVHCDGARPGRCRLRRD